MIDLDKVRDAEIAFGLGYDVGHDVLMLIGPMAGEIRRLRAALDEANVGRQLEIARFDQANRKAKRVEAVCDHYAAVWVDDIPRWSKIVRAALAGEEEEVQT